MEYVEIVNKRDKKFRVCTNPIDFDPVNSLPGVVYQPFYKKTIDIFVDNVDSIHFDPERIAVMCALSKGKDMRYYFYIVSKMESNDVPVVVTLNEMSNLGYRAITHISKAVKRLVAAGLLFKGPSVFSNNDRSFGYFVNPLYAWKGDRIKYLTPEYLAGLKEK